MPIWALYTICIGVWGTTWYALTLQLGFVSIELSIAYRFGLAGILSLCVLFFRRKLTSISFKDHGLMALQGILMYGAGYVLVYKAGEKITSGVSSVLFSTVVFTNVVLAAFYFKRPIAGRLWIGVAITLLGISSFFWPELEKVSFDQQTLLGACDILMAVFLTSCGNIVSELVYRKNIPVFENNAYAMSYGALFSGAIAVFLGHPIKFDFSFVYIGSLLYLSIFGSILTFGCYLTLLRRMGPEKVAMPLVTIPIVSLIVSHLFEHYEWTFWALSGLIGVMAGNIIALNAKARLAIPVTSSVNR